MAAEHSVPRNDGGVRCVGQVRSLVGSRGEVEEAGPSVAVQMVGLNAVPTAGDEFRVCETEQEVSAFRHTMIVMIMMTHANDAFSYVCLPWLVVCLVWFVGSFCLFVPLFVCWLFQLAGER